MRAASAGAGRGLQRANVGAGGLGRERGGKADAEVEQ
jgi:hypothetical protein